MKTDPGYNIMSVDELWAFYNSSNSFFCIIGTDGLLKHANPAYIKATGYSEQELFSKPYTDLIHPEDLQSSVEKIAEVNKGQPVFSYRSRVITKNGSTRWYSWTAINSEEEGRVYCTGEDCTEKKEIEDEMERLSLVVKKTANGITITDKDRKILWVNEAFTKLTGYTIDEVIGKKPLEVLGGPLTSSDGNEFIKARIEKGEPFSKETINYTKNGEPFWMRVEGQPIVDENGKLVKWIAIQTNITNQKMAEELIISNEKKYRSLFDSSPLSNFIYDPHSLQLMEVNTTAVHTYGYTLGEFMHLNINDLKAEKDPESLQQMLELISQGSFHGTCKHKKKGGEIIIADITASIIEYRNNHAVLMIVKDITDKTRLQEELIQEKVNKEKHYLEATLHGQEMERVEIGKELHDNINQMLSTVKLYHDMAINDKKNGTDYIKKGTEILLSAINEIRSLSRTLVAPGANELNISESVQELVDTVNVNRSMEIKFRADEMIDGLPGKIKLTLYRIIQEQLNNILKHANAKKATIEIVKDNENIKLTISDDGQGFDMHKRKQGIGLKNILSRINLFNGTVDIDSKPGKGCRLEVNIPSNEIFKIAI
jgi:PAS domain S-box-containing protein